MPGWDPLDPDEDMPSLGPAALPAEDTMYFKRVTATAPIGWVVLGSLLVPGMTITTTFVETRLMILYDLGLINVDATPFQAYTRPKIDGVNVLGLDSEFVYPASLGGTHHAANLVLITAGLHTVELWINLVSGGAHNVNTDQGLLTVAQYVPTFALP